MAQAEPGAGPEVEPGAGPMVLAVPGLGPGLVPGAQADHRWRASPGHGGSHPAGQTLALPVAEPLAVLLAAGCSVPDQAVECSGPG